MRTDTMDLEKERVRCKIESWLARGARRPESIPPRHSYATRLHGQAPFSFAAFSEAIWPWLVLFAWSFILAGLVGCGGPDGEDDPWCETHRCEWVDLALDPDLELEGATARAAARLDAATGNGFAVDTFGVPVIARPQVFDAEGNEACAHTEKASRGTELLSVEIHIATDPSFGLEHCMSTEATLMHEAIHAFSRKSQHVTEGLFAAHGSLDEKLNGPSLDELCRIGCWSRHDER